MEDKSYLTTRQAARILGVYTARIRQLIDSGDLEAVKFGHVWSISRESVEKLFAWRMKNPPKRK